MCILKFLGIVHRKYQIVVENVVIMNFFTNFILSSFATLLKDWCYNLCLFNLINLFIWLLLYFA